VHLFRRGSWPSRLFVIIHHLAVDGVSWRFLLADLYQACRAVQAGMPFEFPRKTSSFRDWSIRLQELGNSSSGNQSYWLNEARWRVPRIPIDYEGGLENNTVESEAVVTLALSEAATSNLLHEAAKAFNTQINDILLTALLLVFQEWTGESRVLVDLEGHGREDLFDDLDVSRTAGWFTSVYPLLLETEPGVFLTDALKSVKEQIRTVPLRGIEYGIARYLSADRAYVKKLESQPSAEIVFNYLSQVDRVAGPEADWKPLLDWESPQRTPGDSRSHVLEIEGIVHNARLRLTWKYSRNLHARTTIERIADRYQEILQLLIDQCTNVESGSFTPSDFPAARLDQETLDLLIAQIRG
jgi:non-ribosomal peptide synthase protein (TIGR01720 family)